MLHDVGVVAGDQAAVAEAAEVLGGEEAEHAEVAEAAGLAAEVELAPHAWQASSMTGRPCASATLRMASMSHGRPKRSTGMMALVRGVMAASMLAGSRFSVSGRMSTKTGLRAGLGDGLGRGVERERRGDDLVAGADAERAQRDGEAVGAVGDADGSGGAHEGGGLIFEALDVRPQD